MLAEQAGSSNRGQSSLEGEPSAGAITPVSHSAAWVTLAQLVPWGPGFQRMGRNILQRLNRLCLPRPGVMFVIKELR